jgi:hypothetical protein
LTVDGWQFAVGGWQLAVDGWRLTVDRLPDLSTIVLAEDRGVAVAVPFVQIRNIMSVKFFITKVSNQ